MNGPTRLEAVSQGLAFQVLHDQVVDAILVADIVQRADVRVVQAGNRLGFAVETLAQFANYWKDAREEP